MNKLLNGVFSDNFLSKLLKKGRIGFFAFIVFVAVQTYYIYNIKESAPFFLYPMYSGRAWEGESYPAFSIYADGKKINADSIPRYPAEFVWSTVWKYKYYKELSPIEKDKKNYGNLNAYPEWFYHFNQQFFTPKIKQITVMEDSYKYHEGYLVKTASKPLFEYIE